MKVIRSAIVAGLGLTAYVWIGSGQDRQITYLPSDAADVVPTPHEPLEIGVRKQLFVDREIVAHADEVNFTLMSPQKYAGNPVLYPEGPTEGQTLIPDAVLWNPDRHVFQMWYHGMHFETAKELHIPAYAESTDGIHWRRPQLNLREFDGSAANNLTPGPGGMLIRDDHDPNPERRYKKVEDVNGPDVGIWFSPDGIHWKPSAKNPVLQPTGDTHSLLGWDPKHHKYIGYFRPAGRPRRIGISFSDDAENWTPVVPVLVPDEHDPLNTQFYWLFAFPYEDVYLGILAVLHLDNNSLDLSQQNPVGWEQTVDLQFVESRDAIRWLRMGNRQPWLRLGAYQSWDDQELWPTVPLIVGDEIRLYYSGNSVRHNISDLRTGAGKKFLGRTRGGGVGLATLRLDGWVAAQPNLNRKASLTTRSFVLDGDDFEVNADAGSGRIEVELLDVNEDAIRGFSAVIQSDSVRHRLHWRNLSGLRGTPVRLRFALEHAQLYAFRQVKNGA